jgi:hypothetical protein
MKQTHKSFLLPDRLLDSRRNRAVHVPAIDAEALLFQHRLRRGTAPLRGHDDAGAGALTLFQQSTVHNALSGRQHRRRADGNRLLVGQAEQGDARIICDIMAMTGRRCCRRLNTQEAEHQ